MPEQDSLRREQLESLEQYSAPEELAAEAPAGPASSRSCRRKPSRRAGGVLRPRPSQASWVVNIRPKNWGDRDKIWVGKLKSKRQAEWTSDICNHYLGSVPVYLHFPGSQRRPPPFANPNLGGLHSRAKRLQYVQQIAKGDEHQALRTELLESVKDMVKLLIQEDATTAAAAESADVDFPWSWIATPPELGGEECKLSPEIPFLIDEEIDDLVTLVLTHGDAILKFIWWIERGVFFPPGLCCLQCSGMGYHECVHHTSFRAEA